MWNRQAYKPLENDKLIIEKTVGRDVAVPKTSVRFELVI